MNIIKRFLSRDADIKPAECGVVSGGRFAEKGVNLFTLQPGGANERQLYDNLRYSVPIVDAAIQKIIRLTGGYRVICSDERFQEAMDSFTEEIPVGTGGVSIYAFTDAFLDSLLTYGSAAAEILVNHQTGDMEGIAPLNVNRFCCRAGANPCDRRYFMLDDDNEWRSAANPQLIVYGALNPNTKNPDGQSILRGLPCISAVLMRIYQCIGQNFDRVGNVRYAVTYKPSDSSEMAFAKERAQQIAKEWSEGMNAMRCGEVRDFVAVGDVE